jgi:hypothetical protein
MLQLGIFWIELRSSCKDKFNNKTLQIIIQIIKQYDEPITVAAVLPPHYINKRSRNKKHYALIYTNPLFYMLAPTCFGSSLPLSGRFLDPSELPEIQIERALYHIMCGYVACVQANVETCRSQYIE